MFADLDWQDEMSSQTPLPVNPAPTVGELPPGVAAALWRGSELGSSVTQVVSTGWTALDSELPGGGWPCHAITEVLQPQPSIAEWRLLAPALKSIVAADKMVVVVGPPKHPHLPGLRHMGLDERHLLWIQADTPAQRLWVTEQLVKSNACGALVAWLPQARQEQIRRLQICSQICDGPVFLCRPAAAQHEASAAPLRVQLRLDVDWAVRLQIFKRRGPVHEEALRLPSIPGGLESIITPRLVQPSVLISSRQERQAVPDVVGSATSRQPFRRRVAAH
jgi:protein ImuA